MKNSFLWLNTVILNDFPSLDKDIEVDTLVIGAGVSGILCAYELQKRGINVVVVEKDKLGSGTSKDTTAFITAQHETLYQDLIKNKGIDKAREYLQINLKALDMYKDFSKIYDIDYKECDSYLYSSQSKEIILKEKEALSSLGYNAKMIDELPFNMDIKLGIGFEKQATINPLKLIKEVSKELKIYQETMIYKLKGNCAYTKKGYRIKFKNVVIATHYPMINLSGFYFTRLTQRRSYVIAIEGDDVKNTYCSIDDGGLYFRSYDKYLLIGGNDRDSKVKYSIDFYRQIKDFIKDKNIAYNWSGQDCISIDGVPYIGRYNRLHKNYYVITGFNLWGFTWAMASSFIIADLIQNKKEYPLVSPRRKCFNKQLGINVLTSFKNLLKLKTPRCKHLGCALNYNENEQVYECPCHGSRYTKDGKLLDGPSLKNLK